MRSVRTFKEQLNNANTIAIVAHAMPDADAYCSTIAIKKFVQLAFPDSEKQIDVFVDAENVADMYSPIVKHIEINPEMKDEYDLVIFADCADYTRAGKYADLLHRAKSSVNIDHHDTNTDFANNNLVIYRASSTCEVLYQLNKFFKLEFTDDMCKLIYSGIITDTNNLEFAHAKNTMQVLTEISQRNLPLQSLRDHFFRNNNKAKALLLEKALASLDFLCGDRVAFMKLTKKDIADTGASSEDTLGIVNHGIGIKGVDVAAIAIKQEDNSYYVSLRSKNGIDVSVIAKAIGGGGHETMAALQYNGYLADFKNEFITQCKEQFKLHPAEEITSDNLFYDDTEDNEQK